MNKCFVSVIQFCSTPLFLLKTEQFILNGAGYLQYGVYINEQKKEKNNQLLELFRKSVFFL